MWCYRMQYPKNEHACPRDTELRFDVVHQAQNDFPLHHDHESQALNSAQEMWMDDFLHGRFYIAISALMGIIWQPFGASLLYKYS